MSVETKIVKIKKLYPLASELSSVNTNVRCLVDGCNSTFTSESNLSMHLQKCHNRLALAKSEDCIIVHHHCPERSCIYNNIRHFKKLKYLKQHYLKVHADKSFICEICNKGFSTLAIKNTHREVCGVTFTCLDCTNTYTSYESLTTHGRRKRHGIAEKTMFVRNPVSLKTNMGSSETVFSRKNTLLLPKQSTSMQTISFIPIMIQPITVQVKNSVDRIDKEIQTEPCTNFKSKIRPIKRRSTIYTQTCNRKKLHRSAETQTIGDCILKRAIQEAKVDISENIDTKRSTKCIKTQTKSANWLLNERGFGENSSTQTGFNILPHKGPLDFEEIDAEHIMNTSSQTSLNSLDNFFVDCSFANCQQTQTDILYQDEFLQPSVFSSHIETQTNDEIDLCTNMYTQTCDEQLLSDFGFSNIQTQTTWPDYDLFVSTETQTLLTQNTKNVFDIALTGRERSHMETQTDMEFKQLLEEINA